MRYDNVRTRGFDRAADRAGLVVDGKARPTLHHLRHSFGSHLIRGGMDVVRVSRMLGHSRTSTTLDIYVHDVEAAQHSDATLALVESVFSS